MPILTPRLQIKPRQIGEGKLIAAAINESIEHLRPWMPFARQPAEVGNTEEHCRRSLADFILREDFVLSIYSRDGSTFIGSTGLHRPNWEVRSFEIGYWIRAQFEGQGMITESTIALTRFAFEVFKARRLEIRCDARNVRSLKVMQRLGFAQEGVLKFHSQSEADIPTDTLITARYNLDQLPPLAVSWA